MPPEAVWQMSGADEFARGWRVLLAATLGISMAVTAIPFYSLGVLVAPLEEAKGWSRTDISAAATLLGFSLPLALLAVGRLIDRFGVRGAAASGHLMLGLVFIALSSVGSQVWCFWGLYAAAAFLGAGASPITYTRAVIAHFDRHRGMALGICMSGAGLGAAVAPPLLGMVIATHGWSGAYLVLGGLAICLVPMAWCWLPAGTPLGALHGHAGIEPSRLSATREPHPGRMLAIVCALFFLIALSVNGYIVHLIPLLIDSGLTAQRAAWLGGLVGLAIIVGRLIMGWLLDRLPVEVLGAAAFGLAAAGLLLLERFGAPAAPAAALLTGFAIGAEVDLVAYLVSRQFKEGDYSRYFSRVYSAFMLGSGLSPLLAGWIVDSQGSYAFFLRFSCFVLLIVMGIFLLLHLRDRRLCEAAECHRSSPSRGTNAEGSS